MKKYLLAASAALLIALPLSASTRPEPGKFGLKGEWIYFYPAIEDTYFVLQGLSTTAGTPPITTNYPQGETYNNLFNYTSGYRVEGIYAFCTGTNDIRFRWTQLCKTSSNKTVTGTSTNPLFATALPPALAVFFEAGSTDSSYSGTASSHLSTNYYAAEGLIGQVFYDCYPFMFEAEAGVHYAHIKYREFLDYSDNATPPDEATLLFTDTMNGIGPELILDSDFALYSSECYCPGTLYFTTSLRGALLASRSSANFLSEGQLSSAPTLTTYYDVTDGKGWRVVPWGDIRLGLNYTSNFDCFAVSIEAGYEAGTYIKAVSKKRFVSATTVFPSAGGSVGTSFNEFQDFTYHGPYVSAEVMF